MAEENYGNDFLFEISTKIRDLEERQRALKDRTILIGKNLIEIKEKANNDFLELKKQLEILTQNMERLTSFMETASGEFSKFARKEDLEILTKQARMFQPLEFINRKDIKEIIKQIKEEMK